jgi:hypothetical protein
MSGNAMMSQTAHMQVIVHGSLSQRIRFTFDESVLLHLTESDRNLIMSSQHSFDLQALSLELRTAMLCIAGSDAALQLGLSATDMTRSKVPLAHLQEEGGQNPIEWRLEHSSNLPPEASGTKGKSGDRIIFDAVAGPPYLQGDYKSANAKGAVDFALTVIIRDVVWVRAWGLCFVSNPYKWSKQYMADINQASLSRIFYSRPRPGVPGSVSYADSKTIYRSKAGAPWEALTEIAAEQESESVLRLGSIHKTWVRPGMGICFEPPISETVNAPFAEQIFGTVMGFRQDGPKVLVVFRLLLARENMPFYLLDGLSPWDTVQTNIVMELPGAYVAGTFRVWPAQLFQASCIPRIDDLHHGGFSDKIVVCDAKFGVEVHEKIHTNVQVIKELVSGGLAISLGRMKPFPPESVLDLIRLQNNLFGGHTPHPMVYREYMASAMEEFARQKTAQSMTSSRDQLSVRLCMPGRALMELLVQTVPTSKRRVSNHNGTVSVSVDEHDALTRVFGRQVSEFDFRKEEQLGIVELGGPFTFRWNLYVTQDASGAVEGSCSVSVAYYSEKDRMGKGVIKSSKCHPESLMAQVRETVASSGPSSGAGKRGGASGRARSRDAADKSGSQAGSAAKVELKQTLSARSVRRAVQSMTLRSEASASSDSGNSRRGGRRGGQPAVDTSSGSGLGESDEGADLQPTVDVSSGSGSGDPDSDSTADGTPGPSEVQVSL